MKIGLKKIRCFIRNFQRDISWTVDMNIQMSELS